MSVTLIHPLLIKSIIIVAEVKTFPFSLNIRLSTSVSAVCLDRRMWMRQFTQSQTLRRSWIEESFPIAASHMGEYYHMIFGLSSATITNLAMR